MAMAVNVVTGANDVTLHLDRCTLMHVLPYGARLLDKLAERLVRILYACPENATELSVAA